MTDVQEYDFPSSVAEIEELNAFIQEEIEAIDIQISMHNLEFAADQRDVEWLKRAHWAKHHKMTERRHLMVHKRKLEEAKEAVKHAEKMQRIAAAADRTSVRYKHLCIWLSENHPQTWEDAKMMLAEEFPQ